MNNLLVRLQSVNLFIIPNLTLDKILIQK